MLFLFLFVLFFSQGPFRINFKHLEHCPAHLEPKVPVDYYFYGQRSRVDRDDWTFWGNFTTRFTWDDTQNVSDWTINLQILTNIALL